MPIRLRSPFHNPDRRCAAEKRRIRMLELEVEELSLANDAWQAVVNGQAETIIEQAQAIADQERQIVELENSLVITGQALQECLGGGEPPVEPPVDPPPVDPPPVDPPPVIRMLGHGRDSHGGAGGTVYEVTTLNPFGDGSLGKYAALTEPCIIRGAPGLEGIIYTDETIKVRSATTIEALPVEVKNGGSLPHPAIEFEGAHIIARNIRSRPGPSTFETIGVKPFRIYGENTHDVYLENCSGALGLDKSFSAFGGASRWTAVRCIFAWTLWHSNHRKGPHSRGITISTDQGSPFGHSGTLIDCLIAGHRLRYPNVTTSEAEVLNCVLVCDDPMELGINLGDKWPGQHTAKLDLRGCWIRFNLPSGGTVLSAPQSQGAGNVLVHESGNVSNVPIVPQSFVDRGFMSEDPVASSGEELRPAEDAYRHVLATAGARHDGELDALDAELIRQVRAESVRIIDSPSDLGLEGWS